MSQTADVRQMPTIDEWTTFFLCELVLRGKTAIHIRRGGAVEERRRMHAMYQFLNEYCERTDVQADRDWFHFALRLRNTCSPGLIGGFDGFLGYVRGMALTIVDLNLPYCEYYSITVGEVTAQSILDRGDGRMRSMAKESVDAYMA